MEKRKVFPMGVAIAHKEIEKSDADKKFDIDYRSGTGSSYHPDKIRKAGTAISLVLSVWHYSQRLAKVFLMKARDAAIRGTRAIKSLEN